MKIIKNRNQIIIKDDEENKTLGYVTFPKVKEGVVNINHTVVNEDCRGQGLAGILLTNAYEAIKEQNLKAILTCSYALNWFNKNVDKQDILETPIK